MREALFRFRNDNKIILECERVNCEISEVQDLGLSH